MLVLEGAIDSLELRPIAFSTTDEALQYQTVMTVSATLRNPHTNEVAVADPCLARERLVRRRAGDRRVQLVAVPEQSTLNAAI